MVTMFLIDNKLFCFFCSLISAVTIVPIYIGVTLTFGLFRLLVWIFAKIRYGCRLQLMPLSDAYYLINDEGYVSRNMCYTTNSFNILEGNMTIERLRNYFLNAYFDHPKDELNDFKLNFIPESILGVFFYDVQCGRFKVEDHILPFPSKTSTVTESEVMEWLSTDSNRYFKKKTPLWKVYFIKHFVYDHENEIYITPPSNKWAFVCCLHHSVGDGITQIQNILLRMNKEEWIPMKIPHFHIPRLIRYLKGFYGLFSTTKELLKMYLLSEEHFFRRKTYSSDILRCWSEVIPIEVLRGIKKHVKASVNSILVTAIAETMHQYNSNHSKSVDETLVAISTAIKGVERTNRKLTNRNIGFNVKIPTKSMTLLDRLSQIHSEINKTQNDSFTFTLLLNRTITALVTKHVVNIYKKCSSSAPWSLLFSSLPGPSTENVKLFEDSRLIEIFAWNLLTNNLGLGVILTGVGGKLRLVVGANKSIFNTREETQTFTRDCVSNVYRILHEVSTNKLGDKIKYMDFV